VSDSCLVRMEQSGLKTSGNPVMVVAGFPLRCVWQTLPRGFDQHQP